MVASMAEAPAKAGTSIYSEDVPMEDGGGDTCECVRPVCAPDPVCGSVWASGLDVRLRSFGAVGVDPVVIGVGPAVAIPVVVKVAGLQINELTFFLRLMRYTSFHENYNNWKVLQQCAGEDGETAPLSGDQPFFTAVMFKTHVQKPYLLKCWYDTALQACNNGG
ncbi:5'-methylthioadenosine/S-adenosylhomocysteine nucleosidase 1 [Hordeum vulgare]|nr:5'-methylthioadenosine/S-adenosylhomocysteine nucleosidase 1 [Hordeum vulgare]